MIAVTNPLQDPHDLHDTPQWERLFRACISSTQIELNGVMRVRLLYLLHDFRSLGTMIRAGKLAPLIYPNGGSWESQAEFDEMAERHLKSYAKEIKILLKEAEVA